MKFFKPKSSGENNPQTSGSSDVQSLPEIAHAMKNSLTLLETYWKVFPQKKESTEFIERYSANGSRELAKLRELSRELYLLSGIQKAKKIPFDLTQALDEALQEVADLCAHSGISVRKEYGKLPHCVADVSQIKEVLNNLLLNAIHAMEEGGVLCIKASAEEGLIKLSVKDTGSGFKQGQLKEILNRPVKSTKPKGSGLGLWICFKLMQENDGSLGITSDAQKGATVQLYLRQA